MLDPRLQRLEINFGVSPLEQVRAALLRHHNIHLWIKRDDLLHPVISGNKWRKLKHVLNHVLSLPVDTLVSMGGQYSNHLHALAFVGRLLGLKTVGLVRGERSSPQTATLSDVEAWGMELRYVARSDYRQLRHFKPWQGLPGLAESAYWLPEGGATAWALRGIGEIIGEIGISCDVICVPCGTGATLAGLVAAAPHREILGFAAVKSAAFLQKDVVALLAEAQTQQGRWSINEAYHCGGFAKTSAALLGFIQAFVSETGIPLEPVYTGKMLYGIFDLVRQGYFSSGTRIVAVHTGGLQGNRGFSHAKTIGTGIDGTRRTSASVCGSGF